ncbi:MAG: hypothetical protein WKF75_04590 [Singulisphaera sp.]
MPVAPFPRWMVCSSAACCRRSAPACSSRRPLPARPGVLPPRLLDPGRSPHVVPARFMVTCEHGHLDDFPWVEFVHQGGVRLQGAALPLRGRAPAGRPWT